MTNEEHLALMDKLTLLALGEISGPESAHVREHLETCDTCRREFAEVSEGLVLLALTASGPAAPVRSRERLLASVGLLEAEESLPDRSPGGSPDTPTRSYDGDLPAYAPMRRPWWSFVPAFAAVVLAAFAILLWTNNVRLREQLQNAQTNIADSQAQLTQARIITDALTSPLSQKVTLVSATQKPQPAAHAMYMPKRRAIVLIAQNLAPVAPGKAYELWLLPANGAPPMAAGTFRPQANGSAVMTHTEMAATPEAKGFAITLEDAEGSEKPTSPILLSGS